MVKYKINATYSEQEGLLPELNYFFDYGEGAKLRELIQEDGKSTESSLSAISAASSMNSVSSASSPSTSVTSGK